jgi:hypothetical protein
MNAVKKMALEDSFEACAGELNQSAQLTMTDEASVEDVFMAKDNSEFELHLCCCSGCGKQFRHDQFQCHIRFCPNCGNSVTYNPVQTLKREQVIVGGYF